MTIFIVSGFLHPIFGFDPVGQRFHEFLFDLFRSGTVHGWVEFGFYLLVFVLFASLVTSAVIFTLKLLEFTAFALRKCPKCKARSWSWGYTSGFGP